jgi:hypothetical protein
MASTKLPNAEIVMAKISQGDHIYSETFRGINGEKVLEDLQKRFLNRTSVAKVEGVVDPNMTLVNEGAREVVLYIMKRIEGARHARVDE